MRSALAAKAATRTRGIHLHNALQLGDCFDNALGELATSIRIARFARSDCASSDLV